MKLPQFPVEGGCQCGAVRYRLKAAPLGIYACHCKDCQRATGSAFESVVAVPEAGLQAQGSLKSFTVTGGSGKTVTRSFCPDCGSTMMTRAELMPGVVMLTTGPMNDTSSFQPAMQIFCASAQPWVQLGGNMQSFAGMPAGPG